MKKSTAMIAAFLITGVLNFGVPAFGDGAFEAGFRASADENYDLAIQHWEPLANSGDASVMYNLAIAYFRHYIPQTEPSVRKNGIEAGWVWMQLAERFGVAEATGQKEKLFGPRFPGEMEQRVNNKLEEWLAKFCSNHSSKTVCES